MDELRVEPHPRRVRAMLAGKAILDTTAARLVWEEPKPVPGFWVPEADLARERLDPDTLRTDERLDGLVHVEWGAADEWLEEEERVYVHPKDPYKRIDVLESSRHVTVSVGGVVLADSHRPRLLFETGLPVRSYLPRTDVRIDRLEPTDTRTGCAYKGYTSEYWSAEVGGKDVAWSYHQPLPEAIKVAGLVCFYDERVDVSVDGEPQERPDSPFS